MKSDKKFLQKRASVRPRFKGVSSNGANRPKLQTWLNVASFGQPGIGG